MSVVPWNAIQQVRQDLTQIVPRNPQNRNPQIVPHTERPLPRRAAIVHEVSSDEDIDLRHVDASSGLQVTVLPSTLTQT
jgi:hypothetical protein